ncbi:hypothetical protein [Pigmentiphaga sp. NML080357]|uniref:hypothetical protein n=1 Tax=Pigmentiphaga sp. NML080357 TaxID=2008675 RepID=UPI000B40D441|nr:hypothetical protein [Pigmentiphaga sp. NML080357]
MLLSQRHLAVTAAALALAFFTASSHAERNASLAGQNVVQPIAGGQHTKEYARNGQLIYEVIERKTSQGTIEAIEREWTEDGTPLRDQYFLGGNEIKATFWYRNGQVKETRVDQSTRDPKALPGKYVERFSDLGRLRSSGVFQGQFRPVGLHREYDESGRLAREVEYDARGVRLATREYDAAGKVTKAERYLPDGSRRLE